MAESRHSLRQTRKSNPDIQSMFHAFDPISFILSLNSSLSYPIPLRLTTESYIMERGPRYRAYADLREKKLKMKSEKQQGSEEIEMKQTQKKKEENFSSSFGISRKGSSVLAQSVPGFAVTLRKENQKPVTRGIELTGPGKNLLKGTKSANAGEKKGKLMMTRKSSASIQELKSISFSAVKAINGQNRGGNSKGRGR